MVFVPGDVHVKWYEQDRDKGSAPHPADTLNHRAKKETENVGQTGPDTTRSTKACR